MTKLSGSQAVALEACHIREATEADLPAILDIYNAEVMTSTANFDLGPRSEAEHAEWFREHSYPYVVLVAVAGTRVLGWASLSQYRPRPGYRFTAEDSVYVHKAYRRRGIGRLLMAHLIAIAAERGFHSLVAIVDGGNVASVKLHASSGFVDAGTLRQVGHKFDRWLDIVHMQRVL